MHRNQLFYIIKIVFIFIALSWVADKLVYLTFNKISDRVYTGQSVGKLNQFLKIKDSLDFLVFGSSRANHNIDPQLISANSFNMGVNGTNIAYSTSLIKTLPAKKKQIVLLHIDPQSAFDKNYDGSDVKALLIKYFRNEIFKEEINELNQDNPLQKFYWSIGYNGYVLGIIKNFIRPSYNYKKFDGYEPIYVTAIQRKIFQNKLITEQSVNCDKNFDLNDVYDTHLDQLKRFCENNNKSLIFFTSPEYDDECKEDNIEFSAIMKSKDLSYYDLTDYFKQNNRLEYWKDGIHLSNVGADQFMDTIVKIVK